jgi:hypothetical protein
MMTLAAFLQPGALFCERVVKIVRMNGGVVTTLDQFFVKDVQPSGKMPANPLNR